MLNYRLGAAANVGRNLALVQPALYSFWSPSAKCLSYAIQFTTKTFEKILQKFFAIKRKHINFKIKEVNTFAVPFKTKKENNTIKNRLVPTQTPKKEKKKKKQHNENRKKA